jgi:hypothetical protein
MGILLHSGGHMQENPLARMDQGEANRRILSNREHRADFRRVEAASLKRTTNLRSDVAKRIFYRCFYSVQANVFVVSTIGRVFLPEESVEEIEAALRARIEKATKEVNRAIDGAEALMKAHCISVTATFDTVPMQVEVGITSALGRRYYELVHKVDQVIPLLQTLEIEEVISLRELAAQRRRFKRITVAVMSSARQYALGLRNRLQSSSGAAADSAAEAGHGQPAEEGAGAVAPESDGAAAAVATAEPDALPGHNDAAGQAQAADTDTPGTAVVGAA